MRVKAEGSKQKSWEAKNSKLSTDYADYTDFKGT
jgi:hypothetical protein